MRSLGSRNLSRRGNFHYSWRAFRSRVSPLKIRPGALVPWSFILFPLLFTGRSGLFLLRAHSALGSVSPRQRAIPERRHCALCDGISLFPDLPAVTVKLHVFVSATFKKCCAGYGYPRRLSLVARGNESSKIERFPGRLLKGNI